MADRAAVAQQQANLYRIGDIVYFENSSVSCYAIRKIEELNKTASGNVEAKVVCFYRRSDVPRALLVRKFWY
jgi:metastasis-associated protein MTA